MRGATNATPSGGGLRVIAEGQTVTNETVNLPEPAKLLYVCVIDEGDTMSRQWVVATPQQLLSPSTNSYWVRFFSQTQFQITSAMVFTYYYLALG